MVSLAGAKIDDWLRAGGMVVTASDRAARALRAAFHQRRRAEGLAAWASPQILDWSNFVATSWQSRALDSRMLLSAAQEQMLWTDIIAKEKQLATLLDGPRHRLAAMAMRAHELVCLYAPKYLESSARIGWEQDAGTWSKWLAAFDSICRASQLLSASRLPLELIPALQTDQAARPPLLLAGFDRMVPSQKSLFDAWGSWRYATPAETIADTCFIHAPDEQQELALCAQACNRHLAAHPDAQLLVLAQDIATRRGEFERAFLAFNPPGSPPNFEFSLGIPLSQARFARSALLLLKWLDNAVSENELDWLFAAGFASFVPAESAALQAYMHQLRSSGRQRTQWPLQAFLAKSTSFRDLPAAWTRRLQLARKRLAQSGNGDRNPLEWAGLVPQLLDPLGLPSQHRLTSADFQAVRRWEQALDACASLGFDGRRIPWQQFLAILARTLEVTLFAPESTGAPIQIAGPAEAAGLVADAIWFLGADEDAWPATGSTHPMLPAFVRREAAMPHASPRQDWEVAHSITKRILASAPLVHFLFARQKNGVETRPSRLVADLAGSPRNIPTEWALPDPTAPVAGFYTDASRVPYTLPQVRGGSAVLTAQSQCPFKAFAIARLGAKALEPAETGLTAAQRGKLLHAVMHAVWAGPPDGIRNHSDLIALPDLATFVQTHVHKVMHSDDLDAARDTLPSQYLDLEAGRLTRLVTEWLNYEKTRLPFSVKETEAKHSVDLPPGLSVHLRLDRIDRLNDGSTLVIDYKTGSVTTSSWNLPRPDDLQLPLYAGFALEGAQLGGLAFATVRPGDLAFAGCIRDAQATLFPLLKGNNGLVRSKLTDSLLTDWKTYIEQMAGDFLAGRANADPRQYPATCSACRLQAVCRIEENDKVLETEEEEENEIE